MTTVVDLTVANGLCVGCGVCAGICPKGCLSMVLNPYGEYNPTETKICDNVNCKLCQSVCPKLPDVSGAVQISNEDDLAAKEYGKQAGILHAPETGFYLQSYVGHVKDIDHRLASASGGFLTWTLEKLLLQGEVDNVVTVKPCPNETPLYSFSLCDTVEKIRNCSGSCYYPVEISRAIQHVLNNEGRYVIVGLPCVCKAIRLAQAKLPKLRERIKFVLGIICSHQVSTFMSEYICSKSGGNPHCLQKISFRIKQEGVSANRPSTLVESKNGNICHKGLVKDFYSQWATGYFALRGCSFCDDIFAECADAVFMDAWLPEYKDRPEGNSIVIFRSSMLQSTLEMPAKKDIVIKPLSIEHVIASQKGPIKTKRSYNFLRLKNAHMEGLPVPAMRVHLKRLLWSFIVRKQLQVSEEVRCQSRKKWNLLNKNCYELDQLVKPLRKRLMFYWRISHPITVFHGVVIKRVFSRK